MDNFTATEQAYKNGYEQGMKDAVKHGEWVWDSDNDRYVCSRCNKEPSGDCSGGCVSHLSDYCPNCGSKMDGGENNGQT